MITLFTTTKDFTGINRSNQLNAIRSWLFSTYKPEVIIFGRSIGIDELGSYPNLKIIEEIKTTATGAPYANEMFNMVSATASNDICCFLNADILLTDKFFEIVKEVHQKIRTKYLLVGERIDVGVDSEMNFSQGWGKDFVRQYGSSFKDHPPAGSDYFVFPKGQYYGTVLPELYIGRPGWDNFMIYHALKNKYKLTDISPSVKVYHQNHDYSHLSKPHVADDPETMMNIKNIPYKHRYLFILDACNYCYVDNELKRNYARGDADKYRTIQHALKPLTLLRKIELKIKNFINKR
jgi:hypothetical protein